MPVKPHVIRQPCSRRLCIDLLLTCLGITIPLAVAGAAPTVSISDVIVTEGDSGTGQIAFTVSLSEPFGNPVTVSYATGADPAGSFRATGGDGSCSAGIDFLNLQADVVLQRNTLVPPSAQVLITSCADTLDEFDETFVVNLTLATGGPEIGDGQGKATIVDDDQLPSLRISDRTITEGDTGSVLAAFTVSLSSVSGRDVTVPSFTTENATALGVLKCAATVAATSDYVTSTGPVVIPRGSTNARIAVPVCGDVLDEANEVFRVRLTGTPVNATIADGVANGTITDDDQTPTLTVADVSAAEDKFIGTSVTGIWVNGSLPFNVALSAASGRSVAFNLTTQNGTAVGTDTCGQGPDFVHKTAQGFSIPAGTRSLAVPVISCKDTVQEPNETLSFNVTSASDAVIADGVATGTILNNDLVTGSFSIDPAEASSVVGQVLNYAFTWAVPAPQNWRALRTMDLRIRDDQETILWVRWDEARNTFGLYDEGTRKVVPAFEPGTSGRLSTPAVALILAETSISPGGPAAPDVTLNLALEFKPRAAGRTYIVEVAATDDLGNQEDFSQAGTLIVGPRH
jgi:hypothetical protein